MNSQQWIEQIADTVAAITTKELRLAALVNAKAEVLTDYKRLMILEREEMALPSDIAVLKNRLPLLNDALEGALRDEAQVRLRELEFQGVEAAAAVTESTAGIRRALQELLDRIAQAHADANAHGRLTAESAYLRTRFGLAPLRIANGDRIAAAERDHFMKRWSDLSRPATAGQPWIAKRMEWLESERGKAEQRRADEEASRPQIPQIIDYRDSPGRSSTPGTHEPAVPATHYSYIHWSDGILPGAGRGH